MVQTVSCAVDKCPKPVITDGNLQRLHSR